MAALAQSRTLTWSSTSEPVPVVVAAETSTLNSRPVVALEPHGAPRVASFTVYEPPPLSTTLKLVDGLSALRNGPSVTAAVPPASVRFTRWNRIEYPRAGVVLGRLIATGTASDGVFGHRVPAGVVTLTVAIGRNAAAIV